jgi:hypothetical protein
MPATAPTYNNYSPLIDPVTTQQFMRGEFDNTIKRTKILSLLKEKGNIKPDASGKFFERNLAVGRYRSSVRGDLADRSFSRSQQFVTQAIPYAWYEVNGVLSEQDLAFNKGPEALIRLRSKMLERMGKGFTLSLGEDLLGSNAGTYTTGGKTVAASTPVPIYGLPTIFGYGTSTASAALAYNPDTQAVGSTVAATDREVTPNTTYCGVSTHPTNAIAGVDGKENESTSPVITNATSTAWTGTATWASTCLAVLDYMLLRLARGEASDEQVDTIITTRTYFTAISQSVIAGGPSGLGARVVFQGGAPQSPNMRLFDGVKIPYGGSTVYWDAYCPASVVYYLNTSQAEFCYNPQEPIRVDGNILEGDLGNELFQIRTAYDINQGAHKAVAVMMGQTYFNPFYQGMTYTFA